MTITKCLNESWMQTTITVCFLIFLLFFIHLFIFSFIHLFIYSWFQVDALLADANIVDGKLNYAEFTKLMTGGKPDKDEN